ncbi:uncharacterized protein A1O9_11483 [Exophiala aquamarina CBS 119918]|uniref:Uncharacterized protein n=1 Tax=Exophiala aquamarina CBS 119918 TaxID=1182545 RepID=A0A072PAM5_9EURO|nr:uncharacterized protein A1O9_11483 [Exophiala aquamarina CBS 119918]KEF52640.1 hypothetical protein A1O9_11483 [Exophiala aquamarina CBS 119918]
MIASRGPNDAKSARAHAAVGSVSVGRYGAHSRKLQTQFALDVSGGVRSVLVKNSRRRMFQPYRHRVTVLCASKL